jgi:transcription elongation factor Elf1
MSALRLIPTAKTCNRCNKEKLLSEFSVNNKAKDRLQYRCRVCDVEYQAQRREANKDQFAEYSREYQRNRRKDFDYRLQMLINASKQRARLNDREHDINVDDIKAIYPADNCCPIFGLKLEFNGAGFRDSSPSIDRVDSTKGYTRDNIQIISWKANRIKGAASLQDLEMLVAYLKQGD